MKILKTSCLALILFLVCDPCISQTVVSRKIFRQEDGLSARETGFVTRDSFGFFYLTTDVDIMRFDGKDFIPVNIDRLWAARLEAPSIKALYNAPNSKVILRTPFNKALFYIDPAGLTVRTIELPGEMEIIVSGNAIYGIAPSGRQFDVFQIDWNQSLHLVKLFSAPVLPVNICRLGNRYFIQSDRNVLTLEGKSWKNTGKNGSIIEVPDGIIVAGNKEVGLFRAEAFRTIHRFRDNVSRCKILKTDKMGNVILGYSTIPRFVENFYVIDRSDSLHHYPSLTAEVKIAKDVYTDDAAHMWLMAGHHGLMSIGLLRDGARFFSKRPYLKDATFGSVICGAAADGKGHVLYARESAGLFYLDVGAGRNRVLFPDENNGRGFINNGRVYYDDLSACYFTYCYSFDSVSTVFRIDAANETLERYPIPFQTWEILPVDKDQILIGGENVNTGKGQLILYNLAARTFSTILSAASKIGGIYFHKPARTYWIASRDHVTVLDTQWRQVAVFDELQKDKNRCLPYGYYNFIDGYGDEVVVGSLGGGIFAIDPVRLEMKHQLTSRQGLTDNKVVGAIEDHRGNCWISTYNGITVIDRNWKVLTTIFDQDGLPHKELNTRAYCRDEKGHLYFGTLNGLVAIDPGKVIRWRKSHGFYIRHMQAAYHNKTEVLANPLLKSNYKTLELSFIKPDYMYNSFDRFPPYLGGGEGLTMTSGPDRITIRGGKPGEYSIDAVFPGSLLPGKILFSIRRDYLPVYLILAALAFGFLVFQVIYLRRKNRIQRENAIRSRIALLELEALQSQMNPHFLFNALGSIQYFIQTEDTEKADEYLSDFALLMRMILESSHHKLITVGHELKLLELYTSLEQVRFGNRFDYFFDLEPSVNTEFLIPPMITQPFVENAINHGLAHLTERKGYLHVRLTMEDEQHLLFVIRDNGVGRSFVSREQKKHRSRGTQIVQERVRTLNDTDYFHVDIDMVDLMEDGMTGTEIRILFHSVMANNQKNDQGADSR